MANIFQQAGETQVRAAEWPGATSSKFTTNKRHVAAPQPSMDQPHPLFSAGTRKHYDPKMSQDFQWKPMIKVAHDKDAPRPAKPSGVKMINRTFGEQTKARPQRKHADNGM